MFQTFSCVFYLKKPKLYSQGPVPIYMRITVAGKRAEISTGRDIEPRFWDSKGSMKVTKDTPKELATKFNAYLGELRSKLHDAQHILVAEKKPITAEALKNQFTGAGDRQRMLIPIFEKHNNEMEALIPAQYSAGTLDRYKTSLNHTKEFLRTKFNVSDIDIRDIDNEFITDYDFFLRTVHKCANNTAIKYMKNFKKIIRICIANGWLTKDPFVKYRPKLKEVERAFLSEEELQEIANKDFEIPRVAQVRDIFLFSCYTGLAYADVKKLSKDNVSIGIDGEKWIFINRTKTDTPSPIPLLPDAQHILDKYKHHPPCINQNRLLPVSSNQKMNAYLKEIADTCKINKVLTFHIARHTFATTITLNNDVPIESVSKMLGHKNLKTTQHYAKLLNKKIGRDMQSLRAKFADKLKAERKEDTGS